MNAIADVSRRSLSELTSLTGRVAVITGGGRGLGKAIADRFAEAGADIVIGDIDEKLAQSAARDLSSGFGVRAVGAQLDVSDSGSVVSLADFAVEQFGGITIWVNNAGIFPSVAALEMEDSLWDKVFDINVRGVFVGSREAARRMKPGAPNVIINVVSLAGFRGISPGLAAYVGSKHAVRGITRQLAMEFAPSIRVLGIAPTYCVTEGNILMAAEHIAKHGLTDQAEINVEAMQGSRLGRIGVPDDIGRAALFLASDLSVFMTGSTLMVDGGDTI